jgi:hypothetical protein
MDEFWDRVEPHFLDGTVQSIHIVIVTGETIVASRVIVPEKDGGNDDGIKGALDAKRDAGRLGDESDVEDVSGEVNRHDRATHHDDVESLASKHAAAIDTFLKLSEQHFERKTEEDFRANRSRIQFESKLRPRVEITVSKIDCTNVGFNRLLQKWSRDVLAAAGQGGNGTGGWHQTINFNLPETADFDECAISLQASYKSLPFPLHSPQAEALGVDLSLLSRAKLDILQLVPIPSIDASLTYGVPIGLRAGLEESVDRHLEMGRLVQSLFQHLGSKDCALVVRSRGPPDCSTSSCLFHSSKNQYFLLLPELTQSFTDTRTASCKGILYRMASPDSLLEETNPDDAIDSFKEVEDNPFSGYIEASLDGLTCCSLNPLSLESDLYGMDQSLQEQKRVRWCEGQNGEVSCPPDFKADDRKETASKLDETETGSWPIEVAANQHTIWSDDSGVGSLMNDPDIGTIKARGGDCKDASACVRGVKSNGHRIVAMNAGNTMDEVEDSDHEHATSADVASRSPTEATPKDKSLRKEDSETEWNDSGDDSTSSSSDSESGNGKFGTFEYSA